MARGLHHTPRIQSYGQIWWFVATGQLPRETRVALEGASLMAWRSTRAFRVLAVEFLAVAESMDSRANWQGLVRVLAAVTLPT